MRRPGEDGCQRGSGRRERRKRPKGQTDQSVVHARLHEVDAIDVFDRQGLASLEGLSRGRLLVDLRSLLAISSDGIGIDLVRAVVAWERRSDV